MPTSPSPRHLTKRRILRNTSANAIAQAASILSTFIFLPLLLRAFGVASYGVMVLAVSVTSFALIFDLGIGAVLVRLVAERSAGDDHAGVLRATWSAAAIYSAIGVLVAAAMVVLGVIGPTIFRLTPDQAGLLRTMLWISAAGQLVYWPTSAARNALSGLQRYDLVSAVALTMVGVDVAGMVYVLVSHSGPVVLVAVRVAETVIASLAYALMLGALLPRAAHRTQASVADARAMLKSGSPIFALTIAQLLTRQQADKLVLGVLLGPAAVGLYDIAAKMVSLVTTLTGLSASAVLPVAAELNVREEYDALRSLFLRGTKLIATLAAPVVAILIAIAAPFIASWCGPGFATVVLVAQVLLLAQILLPLYELADQVMIARDRFALFVPAGLTCAVVNVVLSVVFVRMFGIVGVALGTLGAMLLEFPWFATVFGREMNLPIRQWLRATAWPLYPLLVVPAVIAYVASRTALGGSIAGLAVVGAVSLAAYWAVAAFAAYSRIERRDLLSVFGRARAGEASS